MTAYHNKEPDRPPADVLAWYSNAVYGWLTTELFDGDGGRGWAGKYRKWYEDRADEFLTSERAPFSMSGVWRLNEDAMWEALKRADVDLGWEEPDEEAAGSDPPPQRPVTPATEGDVDAALARLHTERLPEEKSAAFLLDYETFIRYREKRRAIKQRTPIPCRCCGAFFTVETGQHFANCPGCRAIGRKRCVWCNQVFSPKHNKIKRCDKCLAEETKWKASRGRARP
jgi:hypothetical protein